MCVCFSSANFPTLTSWRHQASVNSVKDGTCFAAAVTDADVTCDDED